jgi:aminopeptidase
MSIVDPRVIKQAEILVDYSLKVKKGENVVVIGDVASMPLIKEIYRLLIKKGANEVRLDLRDYELEEIYYENATSTQLKHYPKIANYEMHNVDCYIRIGSSTNTRGLTGADATKVSLHQKTVRPITDYRVENTRWVVTRFPTNAQAQEADMSLTDYSDFVFKAINEVDWKKIFKQQEKLKKLVDKTNEVHIVGPGTDLKLGKKGRNSENAGGKYNMPDGEVFTSVIENQANGFIAYTYPAVYMGREFHNVKLEFKDGKVVKATADKGEKDLNKILDMDKGSRTLGELGIGNNFQITRFTKDILFDEKIGGSIHLALGKGYKETGSKNESGLHWDMIKDLRKASRSGKASGPEGGELWFDDKLVQKDGKWLVKL